MTAPAPRTPALPEIAPDDLKSDMIHVNDTYFEYNPADMMALRRARPWTENSQYFSNCIVNITAASKMLRHSVNGVNDGQKRCSGMAVEVMGLLVGKPDGQNIIITDVIQLPIQGMESRIEAGDEMNLFIAKIIDVIELKYKQRIVGWYHSHPFPLMGYTHAHLSGTDVQTQQAFQALTPWWTAIVVDPIRSLSSQRFEFGCYRCFPPEYSRDEGVAPNGRLFSNISALKTRWGVAPHRYYELNVQYFVSSLSSNILGVSGEYSTWCKALLHDPFTGHNGEEYVENKIAKMDAFDSYNTALKMFPDTNRDSTYEFIQEKQCEAKEHCCENLSYANWILALLTRHEQDNIVHK